MTPGRPLRVAIDRISVGAASRLEAYRLGDALPAAIERALAAMMAGAPPATGRPLAAADEAAARIAEVVGARMRDGQ
ncbi:MAG TPA: hypothetical protein VF693_08965 [Allosphingosinicella sp.]|jgi:hypothetical protein